MCLFLVFWFSLIVVVSVIFRLTHFPAAKDPCLWQQANRGTCCVPASLIPLGLTWSLALIHRAGLLFSSFVLAYDVRAVRGMLRCGHKTTVMLATLCVCVRVLTC